MDTATDRLCVIKQKSLQYAYKTDTKDHPIKPSNTYKKPAPKRDTRNAHQNFARKAPPKKENVETTQKNEIKAMFMNWFKSSRAATGHIMTKQDVINAILKKLDAKQDRPFEKAMDELKNDGLIDIKEDGVTLVLTQKGADSL
jgi:hypothetical protein